MKEKLYQELALESLRLQHWYRKLCPFYKLFKIQQPQYLFHLISFDALHTQQGMCTNLQLLNQNIFLPKTLFSR